MPRIRSALTGIAAAGRDRSTLIIVLLIAGLAALAAFRLSRITTALNRICSAPRCDQAVIAANSQSPLVTSGEKPRYADWISRTDLRLRAKRFQKIGLAFATNRGGGF